MHNAHVTYFVIFLAQMMRSPGEHDPMHRWTFLTNHAQVLLCIARNQRMTAKDIAEVVGITERAVQRLIHDLEESGYIVRLRVGRQNRYVLNPDLPMRHPAQGGRSIGELIELLAPLAPGPGAP
jgi:predicted HTH transcriptional regulator